MKPLRREQLLALTGTLVLGLLAWRYLLVEASGMDAMSAMQGMAEAPGGSGAPELGYLFVMWSVMMVAMMLPSALPAILLFARLQDGRRARGGGAAAGLVTMLFVTGYLIAWTVYSVVAAAAQWGLQAALLLSPDMASVSPHLSGALLLAAGAYQLTPFKDRCIRHCRSPLSFLTGHWREGPRGAVHMGVHHGAYCVGCCWALMALLFVLGVMNLFGVLALAALVLLEKAMPHGTWVTPGVGAVLLGAGAWMLAAPLLQGS